MRIAFLSSFYPLRGGISQFNAAMLSELGKCQIVKAWSFSRQYPSILFPGKTQYVTPEDEALPVEASATLDTINPFTWIKTAREIRLWQPDLLVMKYWMSWFAPSLGWVARHCGCKSVVVLDNVIPHEAHWFDKPLTKYFLKGCTGFISMSESVEKDLLSLRPDAPHILRPHPLYSHFGEKLPREEACRMLGLDPDKKTLLFFGLIREYKGLDILLEAFRDLPQDYQVLVAGEPYGSFEKYQKIMDSLPGKGRVHVFPDYIRDSEVKRYFSAADLAVLPYRSATQSGISSIAYHFDVPMVVTDVGGLKGTIGDRGTGIVAPTPDPEAIKAEILRYFADPEIGRKCREAIGREKERLGWDAFGKALLDFAQTLEK
ncbi:MAG: glycosyltransferase [Bacteroidales bacterium]|nr:glycosyltransferase [Bacteroidales bacterium]